MLAKHQPKIVDLSQTEQWANRVNGVLAEIPKINSLEKTLEVQDEDAELTQTEKVLNGLVQKTRASLVQGNSAIQHKLGTLPDADKVMTEEQYEQQMSFILKH